MHFGSIGQYYVTTIAICLKEKKENKIKKEKKVWEESCFQRKKCARITTSVFACLANENTALL